MSVVIGGVESNGEHFTVFMTLVDAGFEYELKGRWYPGEDPRTCHLLGESKGN